MNMDQRVRLMIGDLMLAQSNMMMQLEQCQKEIAAKDAELQSLRPKPPEKAPRRGKAAKNPAAPTEKPPADAPQK